MNGKDSLVSCLFRQRRFWAVSCNLRLLCTDAQLIKLSQRVPEAEVVEDSVTFEEDTPANPAAEVDQHFAGSEVAAVIAESEADRPVAVDGIPVSASLGGSFHFMQESELEPQPPVSGQGAGLEAPTPIPEEAQPNGVTAAEEPAHVQHKVTSIVI